MLALCVIIPVLTEILCIKWEHEAQISEIRSRDSLEMTLESLYRLPGHVKLSAIEFRLLFSPLFSSVPTFCRPLNYITHHEASAHSLTPCQVKSGLRTERSEIKLKSCSVNCVTNSLLPISHQASRHPTGYPCHQMYGDTGQVDKENKTNWYLLCCWDKICELCWHDGWSLGRVLSRVL